MRLEYDLTTGALYIRLTGGTGQPVARTAELDDNTWLDLDANGHLTGIEVISYRHAWPLEQILTAYDIGPGDQAQLRAYFSTPAPPPRLQFATPPAAGTGQ